MPPTPWRPGATVRRGLAALACALTLAGAAGTARSTTLETVGTFAPAMQVAAPPGDTHRIFVVERRGTIRIVEDGVVRPVPFLDISDTGAGLVEDAGGERGLQSMAFAPDFATSGRFAVFYTGTAAVSATVGDIEIDEFRVSADPNVADPSSRRRLLAIPHTATNTHYGGQLAYDGEGYLFASVGDGASFSAPSADAQDTSLLRGKLLRIDPRPGMPLVPTDNPTLPGNPGPTAAWAYGLRNPYRFSFDRGTGDLVLTDVGQAFAEEVMHLPASQGRGRGANFGWNVTEGRYAFDVMSQSNLILATPFPPGQTGPTIEHLHSQGWRALIGGHVVRDSGSDLAGRYVYGDFVTGQLYAATLAGGAAGGVGPLGLTVPNLSGFGEDGCGRLYVTSLTGTVRRVLPAGPCVDPPPTTTVVDPTPGATPPPPPPFDSFGPPPLRDARPPVARVLGRSLRRSRLILRVGCSDRCTLRITGSLRVGGKRARVKTTRRTLPGRSARIVSVPLLRPARRLVAEVRAVRVDLRIIARDRADNSRASRLRTRVRGPAPRRRS